jgi:chromosomal replication initiation ATPase DnaA
MERYPEFSACMARFGAELSEIAGFPVTPSLSLHIGDVTLDMVISTVARTLRIPPESLLLHTRKTEVMEARHVVYFLAKKYSEGLTYSAIGRYFGTDHSTVLHGCQKLQAVTERNDRQLWWKICDCEAALLELQKSLQS